MCVGAVDAGVAVQGPVERYHDRVFGDKVAVVPVVLDEGVKVIFCLIFSFFCLLESWSKSIPG